MQTSLAPPTQPTSPAPPFDRPKLPWLSTALIVVAGVLLPALALLSEASVHRCAEGLFDPVPTVGHVFAIAAVPLANLMSLWILKRRTGAHIEAGLFAQALAIAVSGVYAVMFAGVYAVMFAEIARLDEFAVVVAVVGLLPLSPLLSLLAGLRALRALRRLRRALALPARRVVMGGLAAGVGLLVAVNIPTTLTRVMLARAASDDPAVSGSAITWLRRLAPRDSMLRAALGGRARREFDLLSASLNVVAPIPHDKTREIYDLVSAP